MNYSQMIATFPEFSTLSLVHKDEVRGVTAQFPSFSDFNFTSLFAWDVDGSTAVSRLNDNLVIRLPDYLTAKQTFSVLGDKKADDTLEQLFALTPTLNLVPSVFVDKIVNTNKYAIVPERDSFDYMYDLASLVALAGADLKKKRNKVNRVRATLGERLAVHTTTQIIKPELLVLLFEHWGVQNNKSEESIELEATALKRVLHDADALNLLITTLHVDAELCGFSINELLPEGHAISHFEKALLPHVDMPVYLANVVSRELYERGARTVNWEQDLGQPGLRQAKLTFQPKHFLEKYTIHKKS